MFKNFYNSLNSLEYQYSVHNSLLHLHSNLSRRDYTTEHSFKIDNKRTFQRTLTHFIFAMNVRNNFGTNNKLQNKQLPSNVSC